MKLDREEIARSIHDGPNAQAQYVAAGIRPHRFDDCSWREQYLADADAVIAGITAATPEQAAPRAIQWAPSGNVLDGVPGEMMRFLAGADGTWWGYGGGPGAAMTFGIGPFPASIDVLPGQWVVRHDDGTFTVQDDAPAPVSDTRREDVKALIREAQGLLDRNYGGLAGQDVMRRMIAVLAVLPAPPVVDEAEVRERIAQDIKADRENVPTLVLTKGQQAAWQIGMARAFTIARGATR